MPYKHNFWAAIARKGNYNKGPSANLSALRPVHSVQTGSQFLSLCLNPFLLAMTEEFSHARYV